MTPVCYLNPAKKRAREVLEAFAAGCGGEIVTDGELRPGPAVFYGVDEVTLPVFEYAQACGLDYVYIDNGYLASRYEGGEYYRATWNTAQWVAVPGDCSDGRRFAALGIEIDPSWGSRGEFVLVACQSEWWYERHGTSRRDWLFDVCGRIEREHLRALVRLKPGAGEAWTPIDDVLQRSHAVVVHSSNTAVRAVILGVPMFCTAPCAARPLASRWPDDLTTPHFRSLDDRRRLLEVLADHQWTLDEMRAGVAWRALAA